MTLSEIINQRRSVRVFDETHAFDHNSVSRALALAILAPNSSNLQAWEFYRIQDKKRIQELLPLCLKQNAVRTASELVLFVSRRDLWKKRCQWHLDHIDQQLKQGIGDPVKHQKGIRYYSASMPFLYRTDWFGVYTFLRWIYLLWVHVQKKYSINWVTKTDTRVVSHKSIALAAAYFMLSMKDQGQDTCPLEGFDEKRVKQNLDLPVDAEISMIIACGKGKPEGIYYERRRLGYEEVVKEIA